MNFSVANGAVANGSSAPNYIAAEAAVSVSCTISLGIAGFIRPGESAVGGGIQATASAIQISAATATVNPVGGLYAAATKKHALAADIDCTGEVVAFILRDVFATADVTAGVSIVAIPAEELGESDAAGYLTVTASAIRTQFAIASASGTATVPDVDGTRRPRPESTALVFATVYVEAGVNDVYDAFATIRATVSLTLDNALTLNGKTVTATIAPSGIAVVEADAGRIRPGSAAPAGAVNLTADLQRTLNAAADPAACSLAVSATATKITSTTVDLDAAVTFFLSEVLMVRSTTIDFAVSAAVSGNAVLHQPGYSAVGGALSLSLGEATIVKLPTATTTSSGAVTLGVVSRSTGATADTATCSLSVTATAVVTKLATAEVDPVTTEATAQAIRGLIAQPGAISASSVVSSVASKSVPAIALVETSGSCTISQILRTTFGDTTLGGVVSIDTLETVNAESRDPESRTFIRPAYTSEFTRPAQEFEFRRVA